MESNHLLLQARLVASLRINKMGNFRIIYMRLQDVQSKTARIGVAPRELNSCRLLSQSFSCKAQAHLEATHSFFYDGWMLVKEVIASTNGTTTVVEYHWGNDLSGSRGGAAGVGGLLYISVTHSSTPNSPAHQLYIPWYDSNGNITGYWDERGKVVASFDYSAFGETTAYGDYPELFSIRFSTKYHDVESGLYYYTKRFYIPSLHRWLTRDPIEEDGGVNLYVFCDNLPTCKFDTLGNVSVMFVTKGVEKRLFRNRIVRKEVLKVEDIAISSHEEMFGKNGRFVAQIFFEKCYVYVAMEILMRASLERKIVSGMRYKVTPHGTKVGERSKSYTTPVSGHQALWGAILAHERGHATAYWDDVKNEFVESVAGIRLKNKADEDIVRATHKRISNKYKFKSNSSANEAERKWYLSNGFIEEQSNGYVEYYHK